MASILELAMEKLKESRARHTREREALNEEWQAALVAAYRGKYPKRRSLDLSSIAKRDRALFDEVQAPFRERAKAMAEAQRVEEKAMDEAASTAAGIYAVEEAGEPVLFDTVWSSTYSTQPSSVHYARGMAEMQADRVRFHGIRVEVRKVNERTYRGAMGSQQAADFEVWAWTSEVGAEAIRRKAGPPMCEQVKMCWARGVNPRVYNPFLPVGYEEKVGLDFHGGELKKKEQSDGGKSV